MAGSHRQHTHILFDHHEILVFVDNLHIAIFKDAVVLFGAAHGYFLPSFQRIVKLRHHFSIHADAAPLQRGFHLRAAQMMHVLQQPIQQGSRLLHTEMVVIARPLIKVLHHKLIFFFTALLSLLMRSTAVTT